MVKPANKFNTEKTRAMFLCSVLGFLGVHEFYQKKWISGILFLAFFISGIIVFRMFLPLLFIAAFISQIRLVVNKKNTDAEFCLGVLFFILQLSILYFKPTHYNQTKTVTTKTANTESVDVKTVKI
ncbi:MAG: TM2 domain-containing protein [Alphaproteobacteria bacterium]|nr:TM2 domain-containing protein [Alphaproteobacteria bacterium]